MKNLHKILSISFLFFAAAAAGQPGNMLNYNVIPPSPTASALGKYSTIPVDLNTGIPQIEVPLYTVQTSTIQVPVSLSYHSIGIKVEEIASNVGLGWTLNAGGMISRTMMGLPDELSNLGYLYRYDDLPEDHWLNNYDEDDYNMMASIAWWHNMDSEPDEFYYNFNGHSGKFVLSGVDQNGLVIPKLIPYSNIQIIAGQGLGSFKIIDEDGTVYLFGRYDSNYMIDPAYNANTFPDPKEKTSAESDCCNQESITPLFTSSWMLTTIISTSGEVVNFEYVPYAESYWSSAFETKKVPLITEGLCTPSSCECFSYVDVQGYHLSKIISSESLVEFNNDFEREDLDGSTALSGLKVYSIEKDINNNIVKTYNKGYSLNYSYYNGFGNTNIPDGEKRLKLLSVTEEGSSGTQLPPYQFLYNTTDIPVRDSKGQDLWGFYNGKNSNSTLIQYDSDDCFQYTDIRETVPEYTKAGVLEKIIYPTGGATVFDFEVNDYSEKNKGGNVSQMEEENLYAHVYASSESVGEKTDSMIFFIDHSQFAQIKVVTPEPCNCESYYEIRHLDNNQLINAGDNICKWLAQGNYMIKVYIKASENINLAISIDVSYIGYTGVVFKKQLASGLRIKQVTTKKNAFEDNPDDQVTQYLYASSEDAEKSSGVLIAAKKPDYTTLNTHYIVDEIGTTGIEVVTQVSCHNKNKSSINLSALSTTNGNPVSYREVVVVHGNAVPGISPTTGESGRDYHLFSFVANSEDYGFPFPPPLSPGWKRGLELKRETYDKNNQLISKIENEWETEDETKNFGEVWGMKVALGQTDSNYGPDFLNGAPQNLFEAEGYEYISQWVRLKKSTETEYFEDGTTITTSKAYNYDNPVHAQVTSLTTTRSDGTEETKVMRYAPDYALGNYSGTDPMLIAIDSMANRKHMHDRVIEQYDYIIKNGGKVKLENDELILSDLTSIGTTIDTFILSSAIGGTAKLGGGKDTLIVGGALTRYRIHNSKVVQDSVFQLDLDEPLLKSSFAVSSISNNLFKRDFRYRALLKYDAYNEWLKPVQMHPLYGCNTSIIYSKPGGKVMAVFNNANYSQVAYTGFEIENFGGFTIDANNIASAGNGNAVSQTISGTRYYNLGTISRTVSDPGKYILSVWTTETPTISGVGYSVLGSSTGETINGFTYHQYLFNFTATGSVTISGSGMADEVRFYPQAATATSYAYKPLAGLSDAIDENNYTTHFEFDEFSRFIFSEDHYRNGLSGTTYHYRNANDPDDQNFIRTEVATVAGLQQTELASGTLPNTQSNRSISYFDGLGRTLQQVSVAQSPSGKDIVLSFEYDGLGRQPRNYLTYPTVSNSGGFKPTAINDLFNFYASNSDVDQTAYPYSEATFDGSPLNRVTTQANPGEEWKTGEHNIKYTQRANYIKEVRLFEFNYPTQKWTGNTFYPKGTLLVEETIDENDNHILNFKDKAGKLILQKQSKSVSNAEEQKQFNYTCTYYVYDDLQRLMLVITPAGYTNMIETGNFSVSDENDKWNFYYQYNKRGLVAGKKLPGIDWSYIVYDQLGRPALEQDANLRLLSKWHYQKYDGLNRPVTGGLATITGKTFTQLQDDLWSNAAICSESRSNSASGYTNVAYPTTQLEALSTQYYDDYDFNRDGNPDYSCTVASSARTINKLTGAFTKVLDPDGGATEQSVLFYDYRNRIVETQGINAEGKQEKENFEYNFSGQVLKQTRKHDYFFLPGGGLGYSGTLTRIFRNEYDHSGRIVNSYVQVDEQPEIWTTSLVYNDLGQLIKRRLHNNELVPGAATTQKSMQTIDYKYNVRGWLTAINNMADVKEKGDFWGMELHYAEGYPLLEVDPQYNGNISWMGWKSEKDSAMRIYGFAYDPLNRMKKARYATQTGPALLQTDVYTVEDLTYDDNGNILSATTHGATSYNPLTEMYDYGITDNLTYTYDGNRLSNVADAALPVMWEQSSDFKDVPGATDYTYDLNGNLISDANKSITLSYNHLNLPSLISRGADHLAVIYDAAGNKVKEEVMENQQSMATGYFGEIIEQNGKPKRILFDDGYLLCNTEDIWEPYYFIRDHLNDVRIVFKGSDKTWSQNQLTFELASNEEGNYFPQWKNVSPVRNNEDVYQGAYSGKLNNEEGPYTEIPVHSGDSIQAAVFYYYPENGVEKAAPPSRLQPASPNQMIGLELKPSHEWSAGNDHAGGVNHTTVGLQLNIVGLFDALAKKHKKPALNNAANLGATAPDAYLLLSLRDTGDNEIHQWRIPVDSANHWILIGDSIGIHLPDSTLAYKLKVSLQNESPDDVWFDTLNLKLGTTTDPVIQVNHYYPFGNLLADISWQQENADTNQYLYNGKELHRSLNVNWLDYGARWYDPQVGRWWSVDPMADHPNQVDKSPYAYAWNNPVKLTDPDGRCPICPLLAKGATGAAVDYMLQGALNWAGGMEFGDAFAPSNIDKTDVLISGITGLNPFSVPGGKYGAAAAAAVGDVAINAGKAALNGEDYTAAQVGQDFLVGFIAQLGSEKVAEFFGEGVVYLRKDASGNLKPYVGKAKSEERYLQRQKEHARANPNSDFEFDILDRGSDNGTFPTNLDKREQKWLDVFGGPTNKSNPNGGTSNKKNVIKKED